MYSIFYDDDHDDDKRGRSHLHDGVLQRLCCDGPFTRFSWRSGFIGPFSISSSVTMDAQTTSSTRRVSLSTVLYSVLYRAWACLVSPGADLSVYSSWHSRRTYDYIQLQYVHRG